MVGTIAVVDDDEEMRQILGVLLENCRSYSAPVSLGNSLLADKDIDKLDCVIIDQKMPGLSGAPTCCWRSIVASLRCPLF